MRTLVNAQAERWVAIGDIIQLCDVQPICMWHFFCMNHSDHCALHFATESYSKFIAFYIMFITQALSETENNYYCFRKMDDELCGKTIVVRFFHLSNASDFWNGYMQNPENTKRITLWLVWCHPSNWKSKTIFARLPNKSLDFGNGYRSQTCQSGSWSKLVSGQRPHFSSSRLDYSNVTFEMADFRLANFWWNILRIYL